MNRITHPEAPVTLAPRTRLTPTPYAILSGGVVGGGITAAMLASNSITGDKIAAGAIGSSQLAAGAVTSAAIAPGAVGPAQLAPGAAASNLLAGGYSSLPSGTIVMSDREVNPALLNAGFAPMGTSLGIAGETWTNLPSGPPATGSLVPGRSGHQAVWSSTAEMFIIGGSPDNSGLRYNPTANTWSVLNKSNAPAIGADVHAFWSGTQLIVWDAYHRVGGRYTPGTDTWTTMSDTNAPTARAESSAAFANGYLVVWGGSDPDDELEFFNTGGRYNPTNNSWTATSLSNVPLRRAAATATAIGTDIVFFGGKSTNDFLNEVASGARYNPAVNSWTAIAEAPSGRYRHTATWSGTYLLVWGGVDILYYISPFPQLPSILTYAPITSGLKYNPSTDSWTTISTNGQPAMATGHSAAWSSTGSLMIWGGDLWPYGCFFNCGYSHAFTNGGSRYSPASDTWTPMASTSLSERGEHTAVWTGSQMILWGGENDSAGALADGQRYNLPANTWSAMADPPPSGEPSERNSSTSVWTGDALIVWGGKSGGLSLRTGGIYRPAVGWTNTPLVGAPSARFLHSAVWTGTEMIAWGGSAGLSSVPVNTGARFNVSSNRWFPVSTVGAPRARARHCAVWTGTEMVVWGGFDTTNALTPTFLKDGGRYNPVTDTWTSLTNVPFTLAGRAGPTAVWSGNEMIVWGGYSQNVGFPPTFTYFGTGARYHPASNTWAMLPLTGVPTGRTAHTAVWNGEEMLIWGGQGNAGSTNTGARYNPSLNAWTAITTNNAPSIRNSHTAVWAEPPGQMIVWGGDDGSSSVSTGSLYDPLANKWTAMTNAAPPANRLQHVAAWTGSEMVVFDGATHAGIDLNTGAAYRPRRIYWFYQKP